MNFLTKKYHEMNAMNLIPNDIPTPTFCERLFGGLFNGSFYRERSLRVCNELKDLAIPLHNRTIYIQEVQRLDKNVFIFHVSCDQTAYIDFDRDFNFIYHINRFSLSYFYILAQTTIGYQVDAYTGDGNIVDCLNTPNKETAIKFIQDNYRTYKRKRGLVYYYFWKYVARLNGIDFYQKEQNMDWGKVFGNVIVDVMKKGLENEETRDEMIKIIDEVANVGDLPNERIIDEFNQQQTTN